MMGIKSSDLEKDKQARSRYASVYYLYQLHKMYQEFTTADGKRAFPENQIKLEKNLRLIIQTFRAHAISFPEFTEGQDALDFNDPGAPKNSEILNRYFNKFEKSKQNTQIEPEVERYVQSLKTTLQDSGISRGITRKPVGTVDPGNSMSYAVRSYPVAMTSFFGKTYVAPFSFPSLYDAVLKNFQKRVSKSFIGLPPCTKRELTPAEKEQALKDAKRIIAAAEGQEKVKKADAESNTMTVTPSFYTKLMNDLLSGGADLNVTVKKTTNSVGIELTTGYTVEVITGITSAIKQYLTDLGMSVEESQEIIIIALNDIYMEKNAEDIERYNSLSIPEPLSRTVTYEVTKKYYAVSS